MMEQVLSFSSSPLIKARFVVLMESSKDGEEGSACECQFGGGENRIAKPVPSYWQAE